MLKIRIIICLVLVICGTDLQAQKTLDLESAFKMHLFLDRSLADFRGMDPTIVKNDSLYTAFSEFIDLKLDTLVKSRDFLLYNFVFVQVRLKDGEGATYKGETNHERVQFLGLFRGSENRYVLGLNKRTGKSYRLFGFDGNDFLTFMRDLKELYEKLEDGKILSTRRFLKDIYVESLDFRCMYDGLRADKYNYSKYPCLKKVSDPMRFHFQ